MKSPLFIHAGFCLCVAGLGATAPRAAAAPLDLIVWGPSQTMVTSTQNGQRFSASGFSLDLTQPLTPSAAYTDRPIYGGIKVTGALQLTQQRISNDHANLAQEGGVNHDVLDIRNIDSNPSAGGRLTALLLWSTDLVSFSFGTAVPSALGIASLSYTGGYSPNSEMHLYFVLRYRKSATEFGYAITPAPSGEITTSRLAPGGTHELADPAGAVWYDYDPGATGGTLDTIDLSPGRILAAPPLAVLGVTHVGVLFHGSGKVGPTESTFSLYRFKATIDAYRPKAPFRTLYNSDTANIRIYHMPNPGGTPDPLPRTTFDQTKLERSIDEAAVAGVDAYFLSPFATHVPLWNSDITPPDEHFAWWRYAHPRIDLTPPADLDPIGYYLHPTDPGTPGGDVLQVFVNRCVSLALPAFASIRLNDHHYTEDMDARPGLWNIGNGAAIATDYWRYMNPQLRLARAPLSARSEYRKLPAIVTDISDLALSDTLRLARSATVLDWSKSAVRDRMFNYLEEIVEKYPNLDGIELDFLRSGEFFHANAVNPETIMNDFVSSVRTMLDGYGVARQKRYWLSARVSARETDLAEDHLVLATLAEKGVDMFVLCSASGTYTKSWGDPAFVLPVDIKGPTSAPTRPWAAVYCELTEQASAATLYDANGNNPQSFEWLCTREELYTAMHTAYQHGADGLSLFNFAYYRNAAQTSAPYDEPPFDVIEDATDSAFVGSAGQHYFRSGRFVPTAVGFPVSLYLKPPTATAPAWPNAGRLRLHSAAPIPSVTLEVTIGGVALNATSDISEPYQIGGDPQHRLPIPENDSTRLRAWEVPTSLLSANPIQIRVKNLTTGTPFEFHYLELILP